MKVESLQELANCLEVDLADFKEEDYRYIRRAIGRGAISYDDEADAVGVRLKKPVFLVGIEESTTDVLIRRATGKAMKRVSEATDTNRTTAIYKSISELTKIRVTDIEMMDAREVALLSALFLLTLG